MLFEAMPDLDCALASEGSYGPIDRVPLNPGGVELLAFVDRKRGIRHVETLPTHRTNWRLQRFAAGDPARLLALKDMGFPEFGVFVVCSSDMSQPIKGLATVEAVIEAMDREARRSDDGLAVLYSDMRAHKNPLRMKVLRAAGWKLAKRLATLCPKCHAPGLGLHRLAPRPAVRGVRRADALDRFRDRRLHRLRPRGGRAAQGRPAHRVAALLPGLPLTAGRAACQPLILSAKARL